MFNLTKAMMSKNKETVNPLPSDSFSTREAEIIANTLTGDSGSNRNFLNKTKKKEAERKNFLSFKSSE